MEERIENLSDNLNFLDDEFRAQKDLVWETIHSLVERIAELEGQPGETEEDDKLFVSVVKVGDDPERQDKLADIALATYVGEPCRICGVPITWEDIKGGQGVVWAGYSEDNLSRSAHKACWEKNPLKRGEDDRTT